MPITSTNMTPIMPEDCGVNFEFNQKGFEKCLKMIRKSPVASILDDVRQGKFYMTRAVAALQTPKELVSLRRLVDGGLVQIILGLLNHCQHSMFSEVVLHEGGGVYIRSPIEWVLFLMNYVGLVGLDAKESKSNQIQLEIAEGIGSLVKCMCDEKTKEFFKSKLFWYQTRPFFFVFVKNLVNANSKTAPILERYENGGFVAMMIQQLFIEKYRPDIMKDELAKKWMLPRLSSTLESALTFISTVIEEQGQPGEVLSKRANKRLYLIGSTPVVDETYDPECSISFMRGIADLLVSTNDTKSKKLCYYCAEELAAAGCVDSSVIKGFIELGMKVEDTIDLNRLPNVIFRLLSRVSSDGSMSPDDSRYASAVGKGLFQFVSRMLGLCMKAGAEDGMEWLEGIVSFATVISSHPKFSSTLTKDVRTRAKSMLQPEFIRILTRNDRAMKIYKMIGYLIDPSFNPIVQCLTCSKELKSSAIKSCSNCKVATYCSKQCQVSDWKRHKGQCRDSVRKFVDIEDEFKDACHEHGNILATASTELLKRNGGKILAWKRENEGANILDCVIVMDFRNAPPSFEVESVRECIDRLRKMYDMEHMNMKEHIECNRANGAITGVILALPAVATHGRRIVTMFRKFSVENYLDLETH